MRASRMPWRPPRRPVSSGGDARDRHRGAQDEDDPSVRAEPVQITGDQVREAPPASRHGGEQRRQDAVHGGGTEEVPGHLTAPDDRSRAIHIACRPSTTVCERVPSVASTSLPRAAPPDDDADEGRSSSSSELKSGPATARGPPVRRQTKSMTPTVNGVKNSSTAGPRRHVSSSSVKSKPPSTQGVDADGRHGAGETRTRLSRSTTDRAPAGSTPGGTPPPPPCAASGRRAP